LAQKVHSAGPNTIFSTTHPAQEILMAKTVADVMKMVKENEVKFVDFRFTDTRGKEQHVTVPVSHFNEDKFISGHAFDGSSVAGWKGIEASDMQLMPDANTANIDPFFEETTLFMSCDVVEPSDGKSYDRDPRSIAWATPLSSGQSLSSSSLTTCAGTPTCRALSSKSKSTKRPGIRAKSSKAAIAVTVPLSKVATFPCLRLTARRTCVLKCP
jgi:hypothetical protein